MTLALVVDCSWRLPGAKRVRYGKGSEPRATGFVTGGEGERVGSLSRVASAHDGLVVVKRASKEGSASSGTEPSFSVSARAASREAISNSKRASCADSESCKERLCNTAAGTEGSSSSAEASASLSGASSGIASVWTAAGAAWGAELTEPATICA